MPLASFAGRVAAAGVLLLIVGCTGSVDPGATGSGGSGDVSGEAGAGGITGQGGSIPTGGATATGGVSGQAGSIATGGQGGQGNTAGQGNPVGQAGVGGQNPAGTDGGAAGSGGAAGGVAGRGGAAGGAAGRGGAAGGAAGRGGAGGGPGLGGNPGGLEFVGNITTGNSVDTDGKTFSRHWDQITPENAGKWGSVQSNATAAFNWRTLDAIYDYSMQNNVIFKEHAFVWGSQQPGGSIGESHVKAWMTEFCTRYPNTKMIDVVNEPPPHTTPGYANSIGGGTNGTWQWITNSFKWAREACPNAILILNDFNNMEYANEVTHFVNIVKTIKAAGAPIDAIGAQAHALDVGVPFSTVQAGLTKVRNEGQLPVYITELDLSTTDDNQQLQWYQQYFPLFRDAGYVKGITIWGWIYGKTWSLAPNSGLVRNGSPRPAMTWLMQQLGRPLP